MRSVRSGSDVMFVRAVLPFWYPSGTAPTRSTKIRLPVSRNIKQDADSQDAIPSKTPHNPTETPPAPFNLETGTAASGTKLSACSTKGQCLALACPFASNSSALIAWIFIIEGIPYKTETCLLGTFLRYGWHKLTVQSKVNLGLPLINETLLTWKREWKQ